MTHMAVDSRVYGANFRSSPGFGDNVIGFLNQGDPVEATGPQQGGRWIPCRATVKASTVDGFVSKNVLRKQVSAAKEKLMRECVKQWLRFEKGHGKETETPFDRFVGEFWSSIGLSLTGDDADVPWSAAFISFCVRTAGYTKFKFAAAHSKYANQAIRRKLDNEAGPFWGFRTTEHKPQLGDMVCRRRQSGVTYDFAATHHSFKSHCDIVISIRDDHVSTIGGNVSNSVSTTTYRLNSRGFLDSDGGRVYAVLRNNL